MKMLFVIIAGILLAHSALAQTNPSAITPPRSEVFPPLATNQPQVVASAAAPAPTQPAGTNGVYTYAQTNWPQTGPQVPLLQPQANAPTAPTQLTPEQEAEVMRIIQSYQVAPAQMAQAVLFVQNNFNLPPAEKLSLCQRLFGKDHYHVKPDYDSWVPYPGYSYGGRSGYGSGNYQQTVVTWPGQGTLATRSQTVVPFGPTQAGPANSQTTTTWGGSQGVAPRTQTVVPWGPPQSGGANPQTTTTWGGSQGVAPRTQTVVPWGPGFR